MKSYIQVDNLGSEQYTPNGAKPVNYSRIRLIVGGKQVDGADCPTNELLQTLQLVQTRSYNLIVPKKGKVIL